MTVQPEIPPCPHQEQYEHFGHPQVDTTHGFPVDAKIFVYLNLVWDAGCRTICSCQGDVAVKHRFFGKKHEHPAFITFETAADAAKAYVVLSAYCDDIYLERSQREHGLSDEHCILLPPIV